MITKNIYDEQKSNTFNKYQIITGIRGMQLMKSGRHMFTNKKMV